MVNSIVLRVFPILAGMISLELDLVESLILGFQTFTPGKTHLLIFSVDDTLIIGEMEVESHVI